MLLKKIIMLIWLIFILACLYKYFSQPEFFSAENISRFLKTFNSYILFAYVFISIIRGFTLLPGTTIIIAGTLLFPERPYLILFISITCMLISSAIIYFFSEMMGFDTFFKKKYPERIKSIHKKLDGPKGFLFVIIWSILPFTPTDLVSYVAGTLRMNFAKFMTALFIGELPICTLYVFTGKSIVGFFS